jgi:hypothetical protein
MPIDLPEWAETPTNYIAGSDPWSLQPVCVEPADAYFTPGTKLAAEELNFQLRKIGRAIDYLVKPGQTTYNTAGTHTWTCPDNVDRIMVEVWGAGGQGGGGRSGTSTTDEYTRGGGGGAGGQCTLAVLTVTPGADYTVVVGAGGTGAGGAGPVPQAGADGGNSTVTVEGPTIITGKGGRGGLGHSVVTSAETSWAQGGGRCRLLAFVGGGFAPYAPAEGCGGHGSYSGQGVQDGVVVRALDGGSCGGNAGGLAGRNGADDSITRGGGGGGGGGSGYGLGGAGGDGGAGNNGGNGYTGTNGSAGGLAAGGGGGGGGGAGTISSSGAGVGGVGGAGIVIITCL